jgi:hypothetical protein
MRSHVHKVARNCCSVLRQLRSVRRSVPADVFQTLVMSLVISRLDYCNAKLVGIPTSLSSRFQSVMNAAARTVADIQRCDLISLSLAGLHWLRAPERVVFNSPCWFIGVGMALLFTVLPVSYTSGRRRANPTTATIIFDTTLGHSPTRPTTVGDRSFLLLPPEFGTVYTR